MCHTNFYPYKGEPEPKDIELLAEDILDMIAQLQNLEDIAREQSAHELAERAHHLKQGVGLVLDLLQKKYEVRPNEGLS